MENPFKKMFKGEEENSSMEGEEVVDVNFEVKDDGIYAQRVFKDRDGEWEMIYDNPTDTEGAKRAAKDYRQKLGLVEESDLNM